MPCTGTRKTQSKFELLSIYSYVRFYSHGGYAMAVFEAEEENAYTGVLGGSENVLIRLSRAREPDKAGNVPGTITRWCTF